MVTHTWCETNGTRHRCFQGVSGREIERGKVEGGEGKESGRFEILLYFYTQKL